MNQDPLGWDTDPPFSDSVFDESECEECSECMDAGVVICPACLREEPECELCNGDGWVPCEECQETQPVILRALKHIDKIRQGGELREATNADGP